MVIALYSVHKSQVTSICLSYADKKPCNTYSGVYYPLTTAPSSSPSYIVPGLVSGF